MRNATLKLVRTAVIAALYAALTLAVAPIAYGAVQFRISEALTILPLFCPEAIVGLTIGCFLANIPSGLWDMFLGALATLVAATLTRVSRKWYFGIIPPVVVNAFAVPLIHNSRRGRTRHDIFRVRSHRGSRTARQRLRARYTALFRT